MIHKQPPMKKCTSLNGDALHIYKKGDINSG